MKSSRDDISNQCLGSLRIISRITNGRKSKKIKPEESLSLQPKEDGLTVGKCRELY